MRVSVVSLVLVGCALGGSDGSGTVGDATSSGTVTSAACATTDNALRFSYWSERALRSVNLIRNNSLFAGGEEGAVRLCTLLTLVSTCRLIGVDPFSYLEWALTRVVPHRANRGLTPADLTPHAYQAAQQAGA